MNRRFPLAGLLRLRRLEQDQAAAHLGAVNAQLQALASHLDAARDETEQIPAEVDSSNALLSVAAARAASATLMADLEALVAASEADAGVAQRELSASRARTIGLEKLEARHSSDLAAADLAAEQRVLDDLATTAPRAPRAVSP